MHNNKVTLITGSSRGIGAETARLFAKNGYSIVINYVRDERAAEAVKQEVLGYGVECIAVQADVANEGQVAALFERVDQFGELEVLVNNAGILQSQSRLEDISAKRFQLIMTTNAMSCFLCTQAAIKRMSTKHGGNGGTIVNVSSAASRTGAPNEYVDYAASKGAIDSLTIGAAKELAGEGIRVNGVRPALIYTDMHALGGESGRVDRLKSKIPLQRGGAASEVAEAILWLASENSSFVTGNFIEVTGGL